MRGQFEAIHNVSTTINSQMNLVYRNMLLNVNEWNILLYLAFLHFVCVFVLFLHFTLYVYTKSSCFLSYFEGQGIQCM